MGLFTTLAAADLEALAAAFELGAVARSRVIAAGTINSNFEIRTERGAFFLRINEGKQEAEVAWEARLVAALAAAGVDTPPPLIAEDGRPYVPLPGPVAKWVSVFPWRAGRHLAADAVSAVHARALGGGLARLHEAARALPAAWRRASIYGHDRLVERFARIEEAADPALAHAVEVLRAELAVAASSAEVRRRASQGIIHGDLFRDNVLWDGDRLVALLDFEQASGGSLAYDLGVCINDWCWTGEPRLDLAAALIEGYQAVRPLPAEDREALPVEVRAAAARFTITRITDVYLANVSNPEKDFRAFLARVHAWRGQSLQLLARLV